MYIMTISNIIWLYNSQYTVTGRTNGNEPLANASQTKISWIFMERTPILTYTAHCPPIRRSIYLEQRLEIHVLPFNVTHLILINTRISLAHHFNAHFNTYLKQIVAEGVWRELVVHTRVTRWDALAVSARVKIITITNQKTVERSQHSITPTDHTPGYSEWRNVLTLGGQ